VTVDYRHNFTAGLIHGVFFQIAAAFGSIHTVLPSFVALLSPSTYAVGLMASVEGFGAVVPQLFTAYFIEDRPRKKPILLAIITLRWASWGLLAALTLWFAASQPGLVLGALLVLFAAFSIAGGVGTVVYADVFSKAIPTKRRGRFTAWKQILGYAGAIGAGWVVAGVLDSDGLGFPANYSLIFMFSAVSLLVAFVGFAMIREPAGPARRASTSMRHLLRRAVALAKANRNFRRILWTRALTDGAMALAPFYVVFALRDAAVEASAVGIYLAVQMGGGALSNVLWGWMGDRFGNRSVIIGTTLTAAVSPAAALVATIHPAAFLVVFAGIGATLSGVRLGHGNLVLELTEAELRPTCVALQNTLLAPVTLMPLIVAALVTVVAFEPLFIVGLGGALVALRMAIGVIDPRTNPQGGCVDPANLTA